MIKSGKTLIYRNYDTEVEKMKIIVQKFGGTSTGTPHSRQLIYNHIQRACNDGYKVVAIVSAMGRFDDPYATDTLLSLVDKNNLTKEELDRLSSVGETISSLVIKSEFMSLNLNVATLRNEEIGIITDNNFTNANIIELDKSFMEAKLEKYDVLICPGFQAHSKDNIITTLGRGGSDLSAVAIAIALNAEAVEIYSDVNGVFTSDPRIVPNAFRLPYITHKAMLQLALEGAKVLNSRCVEMAQKNNVTIHARSSFSNGWGTMVSNAYEDKNKYPISGVTSSFNTAMILLHGLDEDEKKFMMIRQAFAKTNIAILGAYYSHKLNTNGLYTIMIHEEDAPRAARIMQDLKDLLDFEQIVVRGGIGRVSIVGDDLEKNAYIYEEAIHTLVSAGINIITSKKDGICARFFTDKKDVREAQTLLHDYFFSKTKEEFLNEKI